MGSVAITSNGAGATAGVNVADGATAVTTVEAETTAAWVYSIAGGTHADLMSIDSSTGVLAFDGAPDAGTYQVIVRATDPDNSATVDQEINVDVNPAAPGGGVQFFGSGLSSASPSNIRVVDGGTGSNAADEVFTGVVCQGTRIDAVCQYLIYTPSDSGYSNGNCGTMKVEIRAHDSENNRASATVLAETGEHIVNTRYQTQAAAEAAYPGAIWSHGGETGTKLWHFKRMNLTSPLTVTPGQKIWLNSDQVRGGTGNTFSVDYVRNRHQFIRKNLDPDFDNTIEHRVHMLQGSTWVDKSASAEYGLIAVYEIIGDVNHGMAFYGVPIISEVDSDSDLALNVNGTERARQSYTFAADTTLTSLSIAAGLESGSADLYCDIKQGASTLHTATLTGFPAVTSGDAYPILHDKMGWVTVSLPDVAVTGGTPVYFEMRTTAGTHYEVPAIKDGDGVYFTSGGVPEGVASYSNDSGSTWTDAGNTDLAFAILGVPA